MSDTRPVRLVVVDDNPAVLRQVLQMLPPEFEVVETLDDPSRVCAALDTHRPDILLLDITLPGQSGIALASTIARSGPPVHIVFMTVHSDPDYVRTAFDVGADGYVVKMRMSLDLETALTTVMNGRRFVSPIPELQLPGLGASDA